MGLRVSDRSLDLPPWLCVDTTNRQLQRRFLVPSGLDRRLGGLRNTLAAKGVNLDVDLVQSLQGLNAGGSLRSHDSLLY